MSFSQIDHFIFQIDQQSTVKSVLSGLSRLRPKIGFQDQLSLNAGRKYCIMPQENSLQYFRPSLNYHLSSRLLFCRFWVVA